MHPSHDLVKPSLLVALDAEHRISSKWIARETGKLHKNVLRDIEIIKDESGSDLSQSLDVRGRVQEVWLPLPAAILILARYDGPRATSARRFIIEALEYFIHRAPYVEARLVESEEDNARLRNENQTLASVAKARLPRPKGTLRRTVIQIAGDLIGGLKMNYQIQTLFSDELAPWQKEVVHLPAMVHQRNTLTKHIAERMQNGIRMFGDAAEGLGLERKDCEDTLRDAIIVMCRRHEIE